MEKEIIQWLKQAFGRCDVCQVAHQGAPIKISTAFTVFNCQSHTQRNLGRASLGDSVYILAVPSLLIGNSPSLPLHSTELRTGDKSSLIGTRAIFLSEEQSKQRRQRQSKLFLRLTSAKTVRFIIPGGGDPHFLLIKSAEGRAKMELLWFAWKVENCALSPILNSL